MKIYNNLSIKKNHKDSVVAIGNFDGIHLGHQKVIKQARQKAKKNRLPMGVITFEPMPAMFFNKENVNHRINSLSQKINQLKKLKIDFLIIIKFNKRFSKLSAEKFIEKIIFKKVKCKFLYVSNNFKFGYKRQGNIKTLKRYSNSYNYPIMRRTGFQLNVSPKNRASYDIDFFISDLSQFFNSGGLMGFHFSYHLSKRFPLTIGYGQITDFNQLSELELNKESTIRARELDFNYRVYENKMCVITSIIYET